jgi:hypothetical protein
MRTLGQASDELLDHLIRTNQAVLELQAEVLKLKAAFERPPLACGPEERYAEKVLPDGIGDEELIAVLKAEGITREGLQRLLDKWTSLDETSQS